MGRKSSRNSYNTSKRLDAAIMKKQELLSESGSLVPVKETTRASRSSTGSAVQKRRKKKDRASSSAAFPASTGSSPSITKKKQPPALPPKNHKQRAASVPQNGTVADMKVDNSKNTSSLRPAKMPAFDGAEGTERPRTDTGPAPPVPSSEPEAPPVPPSSDPEAPPIPSKSPKLTSGTTAAAGALLPAPSSKSPEELPTSLNNPLQKLDRSRIKDVGVAAFHALRAHVGWLIHAHGADIEFENLFRHAGAMPDMEFCTAAMHPSNTLRNRYGNVLPYDGNRVKLRTDVQVKAGGGSVSIGQKNQEKLQRAMRSIYEAGREAQRQPGAVLDDQQASIPPYGYTNMVTAALEQVHAERLGALSEEDSAELEKYPHLSDFINATYLHGGVAGRETMIIAAQGPKDNTLEDFWRMIWEQEVNCIVMLGQPEEGGVLKFHEYWPTKQLPYVPLDLLEVKLEHEDIDHHDFVERLYSITPIEGSGLLPKRKRWVSHFMFTRLLDHGIPENTKGFVNLVELVELQNRRLSRSDYNGQGLPPPALVHCSAGLGRTGLYCAVAIALNKALRGNKDAFRLFDIMLGLRRQRAGMVQTQEQLLFSYLCILDEVTPLFTDTACEELPCYRADLNSAELASKALLSANNNDPPVGLFLVRPSPAADKENMFIVSYVDVSDEEAPVVDTIESALDDDEPKIPLIVRHMMIERQPGVGFTTLSDGVLYCSIGEMCEGLPQLTVPFSKS